MQWTWVLTWESTKASPTWALPTKGCASKQKKNHVPVTRTPSRGEKHWNVKDGNEGSKRKAHPTSVQQCLERLLLDMPQGRDNPSSGLSLLRGAISHFRQGICNHEPKPNEDAEQDNHFRAHGWVRGESDKGSLGDNLQNVYYKIQYRLAKCFPMFSNTYTAGRSTANTWQAPM